MERLQYARTPESRGAVSSGPKAVRPGVPWVVLERLPKAVLESSVGTRSRKRRHRSADSGDGGTTGIPRGLAVPGCPGSRDSDDSTKQTVHSGTKRLNSASTPTVGTSLSGGELANTSSCVDGLYYTRTRARGSGCMYGLPNARTPTVSGSGSLITGGCVHGLVLARTPAGDSSGVDGLHDTRTPTVDNCHTIASVHLLANDAMPRTHSSPWRSGEVSPKVIRWVSIPKSCRRAFGSYMGLRLHQRRKHPADLSHRSGLRASYWKQTSLGV